MHQESALACWLSDGSRFSLGKICIFVFFSPTCKSMPGMPDEPPEKGPWGPNGLMSSATPLCPKLLFCIWRSLGWLWLLWLSGTTCRKDELGSQSHILKMRWLIREKLLATSLSPSSCPVLFRLFHWIVWSHHSFPKSITFVCCVVCSPTYEVR